MSETVQGSETPPTSEAAGESSQTQLARDLEVYEYWDAGTYGAWSEAKRSTWCSVLVRLKGYGKPLRLSRLQNRDSTSCDKLWIVGSWNVFSVVNTTKKVRS